MALDPLITVIVPTRDRAGLLAASLASLAHQTLPPDRYEVVVVDDGSTDGTPEVCASMQDRLDLRHLRIAPSGISAAKNLGVFAAAAPLLLFFDDDDVADPNLLREHVVAHRRRPERSTAVLGYTTWAPHLPRTHLMHFVTDVAGYLFSCEWLTHDRVLDYRHFWGGRSSCKKSFLAEHGVFDQGFGSIFEDIELAWRLSAHGFQVVYDRRAISYMNRGVDLDSFCERRERQGRAGARLAALHPVPEILEYCQAAGAEARWAELEAQLPGRMAEARALEVDLAAVPAGASDPRIRRLHGLYRQCFDGSYLRGLVAAAVPVA